VLKADGAPEPPFGKILFSPPALCERRHRALAKLILDQLASKG
jgi:hypothetical protein